MTRTVFLVPPAAIDALPGRALFLAGGISGCPDWQSPIAARLSAEAPPGWTGLNPRRPNFPMDDPRAAEVQIRWEHAALRRADLILFWFPKDTLCPITLYELGAWSMTAKPLVIGVEPGYQRAADVRIQTALARPELTVVASLDALAEASLAALRGMSEGPQARA